MSGETEVIVSEVRNRSTVKSKPPSLGKPSFQFETEKAKDWVKVKVVDPSLVIVMRCKAPYCYSSTGVKTKIESTTTIDDDNPRLSSIMIAFLPQKHNEKSRNALPNQGREFSDDPQRSRLLNEQSQSHFRDFLPNQGQEFSDGLQRSSSSQQHQGQPPLGDSSAFLHQGAPSPPRSTSPHQQQPLTGLGSGERSSPSSPNSSYRDDNYSSRPPSPSDSDSNSDVPSLPESSTDRDYLIPTPDLATKLACFEDKVILLQYELRQYREERKIHDREQLQLLQQLAESKTELQDWLEVAKKEISVSACSAIDRGIATFLQILPEEIKTVMRQNLMENQDRSDITALRDILNENRGETAFVRQPDRDQLSERGTRQDAIVDNRPKRDQGDTL